MLHNESSFIYPLMALHMRLPIIFLTFALITDKLQEKLANKDSSSCYSCAQCPDKRGVLYSVVWAGAPGAVCSTDYWGVHI